MEDWEVIEDSATELMKQCRKAVLHNVEKEKGFQVEHLKRSLKNGNTRIKRSCCYISKNTLEHFKDDIISHIRSELELDEQVVQLSVKGNCVYCTIDVERLLKKEKYTTSPIMGEGEDLPRLTPEQIETIKEFLCKLDETKNPSEKLKVSMNLMDYTLPILPVRQDETPNGHYTKTTYCKIFEMVYQVFYNTDLPVFDKQQFVKKVYDWKEHLLRVEKIININPTDTFLTPRENLESFYNATDDLFTTKRLYEKLDSLLLLKDQWFLWLEKDKLLKEEHEQEEKELDKNRGYLMIV